MFRRVRKEFIDPKEHQILQLWRSKSPSNIKLDARIEDEPAEASFILAGTESDQLCLFIGLFLTKLQERVIFESEPFVPESSAEMMSQAEQFASELGFQMEDTGYALASDPERELMISSFVFFYKDLSSFRGRQDADAQNAEAPSDTSAVAFSYFAEHHLLMLTML